MSERTVCPSVILPSNSDVPWKRRLAQPVAPFLEMAVRFRQVGSASPSHPPHGGQRDVLQGNHFPFLLKILCGFSLVLGSSSKCLALYKRPFPIHSVILIPSISSHVGVSSHSPRTVLMPLSRGMACLPGKPWLLLQGSAQVPKGVRGLCSHTLHSINLYDCPYHLTLCFWYIYLSLPLDYEFLSSRYCILYRNFLPSLYIFKIYLLN